MFFCAVAKPRLDPSTGSWFDGKIGCWPFVESVQAKRSSANRPKGARVTAGVPVDKATYAKMLLENVISATKRLMAPHLQDKVVCIQHDNAKPHSAALGEAIVGACTVDGWKIRFDFQPPNSPDTNVLDLGFFRAVQTLQIKERASTIDDIITATYAAWNKISHETLLNNLRTLELVMVEILKADGDNSFCIPHVGKARLERSGRLPEQWVCPAEVKSAAVARSSVADGAAYTKALEDEVAKAQELVDLCTAFEEAGIDDDPAALIDDDCTLLDEDVEANMDDYRCPEDEQSDSQSFEIWAI